LNLGVPEWVDDAAFDLSHHIHRVSLPWPGDDRELFTLVAEIMSWRLDRSRPLWEIWVVEGLSDNRWAMVLKVHHCIADAVGTAHILAGLADGGTLHRFAARPAPTQRVLPTLNPIAWIRGVVDVVRGAVDIAGGLLPSASVAPPPRMTNLRRYVGGRIALDDVSHVCDVFDVSIHDVALAALTESVRDYLIRHGEQPLAHMLPSLPVEERNAVMRLRQVHARLSSAPPPARSEPLEIMGRRVTDVMPIPWIATQMRTGIALFKYADDLYFGILADFDAMSDVDELARGIEAAVARLVAVAKRRKPTRDRRGLSLVVSA
jgi:WS/DGAT/MGAT family acyltransferase